MKLRLTVRENAPVRELKAQHNRAIADVLQEVREILERRGLWHPDDLNIALEVLGTKLRHGRDRRTHELGERLREEKRATMATQQTLEPLL